MTPEIASAIAFLKAKAKAIGEAYGEERQDQQTRQYYAVAFPKMIEDAPNNIGREHPTDDQQLWQLRDLDATDLETRLRLSIPNSQHKIRAKLVAEFGRSTLGELFEVVAERILQRGAVADDEEFRAVEPFAFTYCQYGGEVLGEENAKRLCGLLEEFRSEAR